MSGHLGLPLGAAEMGAVLFGQSMTFNPDDPQWVNRDRFVLSAGHGSMFLYSWLHLAGYDIPKDEVANFRQHHSATPGHPEFPNSEHTTPGIEATTGPLGAGISNCAGLAAASKMSAAMFNTPEHTIFDNHIFYMVGDGCLQEGVSAEASCFEAHEKLDNLIVLYDANDVTLDKMAEFTQSEDVGARYEAYGWDVITLTDGHDLKAIYEAIEEAKANDNGKPTMIIAKTEIGRGIDEVAGTNAAQGLAGGEPGPGQDPPGRHRREDALRGRAPQGHPQGLRRGRGHAHLRQRHHQRHRRRHAPLHLGLCRPPRLEQELHQGRRRLRQVVQGPQRLLRHPRARHGLHHERLRLLRPLPPLRRDLPRLRRLHARRGPHRRARRVVHLDARLHRRRRGRPDAPARRDGLGPP